LASDPDYPETSWKHRGSSAFDLANEAFPMSAPDRLDLIFEQNGRIVTGKSSRVSMATSVPC
jgi:hypothetical protein